MPHATLRDRAGDLSGLALGPLAGVLSALRGGRVLHPSGIVLEGEAQSVGRLGPVGELAARLEGPVLVRLSSAWWKEREWKDVLGCALRFRARRYVSADPDTGDQDLLFATIRHVLTLPFAPITTHQHDFMDNDYYAITPFWAPPLGKAWFRLRALIPSGSEGSREARLLGRLQQGSLPLQLEVATTRAGYSPLLRIYLLRGVELDQGALRFDPFRSGRDIRPAGYIHHLRRITYPTSQLYRAWKKGRGLKRA